MEKDSGPQLALMVGLPRSGKTTIAKEMETLGWVRVSPDEIRQALHGQTYIPQAEPMVWSVVGLMVRALLLGDRKVLLDAANVSMTRRRQWYYLAREFQLELNLLLVETPFEVCLQRNSGKGSVSPDVLERMQRHFERPTTLEGIVYEAVFQEEPAGLRPFLGWRLVQSAAAAPSTPEAVTTQ